MAKWGLSSTNKITVFGVVKDLAKLIDETDEDVYPQMWKFVDKLGIIFSNQILTGPQIVEQLKHLAKEYET